MDPNSGRIYAEDEIKDLPPEIQDRLIHGSKEELEELQKHIYEQGIKGITPSINIVDEAQEIDVRKEAEELGELLDEMDKVISMDDPLPNEKFYPINRAARRAAEKHERKQRFVNKPGKTKNRG